VAQKSSIGGMREQMQEEKVQQFFKDLSATAEKTVREIRSFTINYYNAVGQMLTPVPWLANFNTKLRVYVEQDFDAAVGFARDIGQASDITEFTRIYVVYVQQCVELFAAQARDFAEAYLEVSRDMRPI
jgi:hypothetical protein